jgi:predicted transcriptional regulator
MQTKATPTASGPDIRARRIALGATRQEIAHEAECSMSYLAALEAGFAATRSNVLPRVVAALDRLAMSRQGDANDERGAS